MKTIIFVLIIAMLAGCEDTYRYPCQNPENKDKPECTRPMCEAEGICYDTLNGLPPQQSVVEQTSVVEETAEPATEAVNCNCENTGE